MGCHLTNFCSANNFHFLTFDFQKVIDRLSASALSKTFMALCMNHKLIKTYLDTNSEG